MSEVDARLKAIEDDLSDLKKSGKDFWDVVSAVGALLIPVAIAFAGYYYSNAATNAQIKSEETRAANSLELAKAGSRVSQANFIIEALEALSSEDEVRKKFAIEALLLALPEKGQTLLEQVALNSDDRENKAIATTALTTQLAEDLFSDVPQTRLAAEDALTSTWSDNQEAIDAVIQKTSTQLEMPQTTQGTAKVNSSVEVLKKFDPSLVRRNSARVAQVESKAQANDRQ